LIQLGAYSNPANFNGSRVSLVGPIVDRKKGTLTLKLIGGFNTLQDARNALPQARQAGFAGAFVVEDRNGVLVKVN
ncbi:MAG: SPOR domain-containing protein, partial [Haliscomenobacter sp.]|nr:SPOR domain-containing protein [Haliscomenobacter sp.]